MADDAYPLNAAAARRLKTALDDATKALEKSEAAHERVAEEREDALVQMTRYFAALEDIDALIALWQPSARRTREIDQILKATIYTTSQ